MIPSFQFDTVVWVKNGHKLNDRYIRRLYTHTFTSTESLVWWHMPIIPELEKQRQKDEEFKARLSYICIETQESCLSHMRTRLKTNKSLHRGRMKENVCTYNFRCWAEKITQLVKYLLYKREDLSSIPIADMQSSGMLALGPWGLLTSSLD